MAEINPTRINQPSVDSGAEITPDGNPIQQSAAPQPTARTEPQPINKPAAETEVEPTVIEKPSTEEPKNTDFTDFLKVRDDLVDEPKIIEKPEEKEPEVETVPKDETTPVVPVKEQHKQTDARDYSDLDESEAKIFRAMSNEAFNKLKPAYIERKQLKTELADLKKKNEDLSKGIVQIPDSYYEHPNGFVLTPEFETVSAKLSLSQQILNHWEQQAQKIAEGSTDYDMLGIQNGQLIITGKVPADKSAEYTVQKYIRHADTQLTKQQVALEQLSTQFKSKNQEAKNWLDNFSKQTFGIFYDAEKGKTFEPVLQQVIKAFPPAYRNNPLAHDFARALIVLNQATGMLKELQDKTVEHPIKTKQEVIKKTRDGKIIDLNDRKKAGPTASDTGGASTETTNGSEVTFDDFEKVKAL